MAWTINGSRYLRAVIKSILVVSVALLGIFISHQSLLPLAAFLFPSLDVTVFDLGSYGAYPIQQYASFHLGSPQARRPKWDESCDSGIVLLTPNGPSVSKPGPMILDSKGELIWMSDDFGTTANLKVQNYQGEDYLTFWAGDKAATSGKGVYMMLDSTYQVVRTVSAAREGLFGDLHEFKITPEGTGLLSVYNTTTADLRGMGMGRSEKGWIVDNLFQEINIETGELLFQWSAAEHFASVDTHYTNPLGGYRESMPFDFYHLNSIDKDSQGNYLISARHFHHVICISSQTQEILWILGGEDNQFEDLSDGKATNFKWQHDARWISEEHGLLSLFDNSKAGPLHSDAPESRAMVIQLDVERRTAKLVQSMTSLQGILASSQGSVQFLPGSQHFFVGWGSAAAYSEYFHDGDLICETHLGASWFYRFERMKSYRTTKALAWHGRPLDAPRVNIDNDILSVSWNGATEVAFWALEATPDPLDEDLTSPTFAPIDLIPKTRFETTFHLPPSDKPYTHFRIAALDAQHNLLHHSDPFEANPSHDSSYLVLSFKLFIAVGFLLGMRFAFRYCRTAAHGSFSGPTKGFSPAWAEWRSPGLGDTGAEHGELGVYRWVQLRLASVKKGVR